MAEREIAATIIALAKRDLEVRERLASTGQLFDGYWASMERVHVENAQVLESSAPSACPSSCTSNA